MCVGQQLQQQPQQQPQRLTDCVWVIWKNYEAYGLCLKTDNLEKAGGQLALIGNKDGKVILTRPISRMDEERAIDDMGHVYFIESFHHDYKEYESARSNKDTVVIRQFALGCLEDGTPYIQGRIDFYEPEAKRFRKAIKEQHGMNLLFVDGTQGFVDPFSINGGQQYLIYGESWGVRRTPSTKEPIGEPMFGYKGASLPNVFQINLKSWKKGGIGECNTLSMEKARAYEVI